MDDHRVIPGLSVVVDEETTSEGHLRVDLEEVRGKSGSGRVCQQTVCRKQENVGFTDRVVIRRYHRGENRGVGEQTRGVAGRIVNVR